jgi:transcriptional regulator
MGQRKRDHLQGALDLLLLRTLNTGGTMHGYGIAVRIEDVSREALRVEEGSLYPALHRMERVGWIEASWGRSDNQRRAKFYTITSGGQARLAEAQEDWTRLVAGVIRVLKFA